MKCIAFYNGGITVGDTTIVSQEGKWYKITFPVSNTIQLVYWVIGENEQEALDTLADFFERNSITGMYKTFDELWDEAVESGENFEDYGQGFICCGNHGVYLDAQVQIRLIENEEELYGY